MLEFGARRKSCEGIGGGSHSQAERGESHEPEQNGHGFHYLDEEFVWE